MTGAKYSKMEKKCNENANENESKEKSKHKWEMTAKWLQREKKSMAARMKWTGQPIDCIHSFIQT